MQSLSPHFFAIHFDASSVGSLHCRLKLSLASDGCFVACLMMNAPHVSLVYSDYASSLFGALDEEAFFDCPLKIRDFLHSDDCCFVEIISKFFVVMKLLVTG